MDVLGELDRKDPSLCFVFVGLQLAGSAAPCPRLPVCKSSGAAPAGTRKEGSPSLSLTK